MKVKSESEVTQSCPTRSDPMDCSIPGSSVHGIFQARVLEWGAIAFPMLGLQNLMHLQAHLNWALNFHQKYLMCLDFIPSASEKAQRREAICPRSHSQGLVEPCS